MASQYGQYFYRFYYDRKHRLETIQETCLKSVSYYLYSFQYLFIVSIG